MRRILPLLAALIAGTLLAPAALATPDPTPAAPTPAAQVRALETRLEQVQPQVHALEAQLNTSLRRYETSYWNEQAARARAAAARMALVTRIRSLFILGSGPALGSLMNARSAQDVSMIQNVLAPEVDADVDAIAEARRRAEEAQAATRLTLAAQHDAQQAFSEMTSLVTDLQRRITSTTALAQAAGLDPAALRAEAAGLTSALQRSGSNLASRFEGWGYGEVPYARLKRLLGPDGGEGCAIPEGLRDTGAGIGGEASWYGWENGSGTASGVPFDPKEFTAAHLTLPFGTFLRVHHGNRCAIVIITDRGPYVAGRMLDLSWGSAQYLHVSVAQIQADILVPAYSV